MMTIRGHRRDATAKFPHLSRWQDRQLILDFGGSGTKNLDVKRHIFDVEARPERVHLEEPRLLLIDAPQEALPDLGSSVSQRGDCGQALRTLGHWPDAAVDHDHADIDLWPAAPSKQTLQSYDRQLGRTLRYIIARAI
jgi:hypothetical protein